MKNRDNVQLRVRHNWVVLLLIFALMSLTAISAVILSRRPNFGQAYAVDLNTPIAVTVASVCTITGTTELGDEHSVEMSNGNYIADVGETTISVTCNDGGGFSVYAIGYTGNEDGVTSMIGVSSGLTIPTGLVTDASASNWAMKLAAVSGTYTPTILSDVEGPFTAYHTIPSVDTKVATRPNGTSASSSSQFTTTFAFGVSAAQAADTYIGKVKFTLVHPNIPDPSEDLPTISDITYMQDFSSLSYDEYNSILSSMTLNQQYQLTDNRDGKEYNVAKLADGNIWMTQNLDHDIVTTEGFYTYANTDIGHGSTPNTSATWTAERATYETDNNNDWFSADDPYSNPESYDPGDLCWNGVLNSMYSFDALTVACGSDKHYHIGNYYNWTAAVAMNDSSGYTMAGEDVDQSICPAGWRLPNLSGNKSYGNLFTILNLNIDNIQYSPTYLVYGGRWGSDFDGFASSGYYLSSVFMDDDESSLLEFSRYWWADGSRGNSDNGYSVRCVARGFGNPTGYVMQEVEEWGEDLEIGDEVIATDNRDGKEYNVAKLADGNIWMTQNLDHDIVTTEGFYTYANTDIGHGSTPNTSATWTAEKATYTNDSNSDLYSVNDPYSNPQSYDPGDLCWNGVMDYDAAGAVACNSDKHYHIGNYYNWTAAVAMNDSSGYTIAGEDVDQSICPAGWRLPILSGNKSYDNLVTELNLTINNFQYSPTYFMHGSSWSYRWDDFQGWDFGNYWSSVAAGKDSSSNNYSSYIFFLGNDYFGQTYTDRSEGLPVRCAAR